MNTVITFANENKSLAVPVGTTVLDAARQLHITALESPCNGRGTCGKCLVSVGVCPDKAEQVPPLTNVLACQTHITENMTVFTQSKELENKTLKILGTGKSFSYTLQPFLSKQFDGEKTIVYGGGKMIGTEIGNTADFLYGLAVDIGTTTLVVSIIDLLTGKELAAESKLNPQSAYAQDVLSRIHFAGNSGGLATMQTTLTGALNQMLTDAAAKAGVNAQHIYEAVYSGNTAMLHLACGVNPKPLGQYPYTSQVNGGEHLSAETLFLNISPFGLVYLPPIISAFVGADITSGVLVSQLFERKETVLFIDIGTNGEMVLAKNGALAACSTAAGPAFEGMNIACGMRAGNGAVESFHIEENGSITFQVIGNVPATGICGSGLLDITGELVRTRIIGKTGRFIKGGKSADKAVCAPISRLDTDKKTFFITDDVYLTQNDVRQIQLAKGAIRSGIESLLTTLHLTADDVDQVEIAGSFGYHLNEKSLLDIGLLPAALKGKVSFVGNTAQSGGIAFLLNTEYREKMFRSVTEIQKIELANNEGFEKLFVASLEFSDRR
ncbi:(Fe-S)-binding protein [Planctomycetales bacterium]|nr:(Fe-S)-binding protein [Planctomycetales bacterium]